MERRSGRCACGACTAGRRADLRLDPLHPRATRPQHKRLAHLGLDSNVSFVLCSLPTSL